MADPWSWNTVFETLLGTGVGAFVGVGGIWWQTNKQRKTDHESRLASILYEASDAFNSILTTREITERTPHEALRSQSLKFQKIAVLCDEHDQMLVTQISEICLKLVEKSPDVRREIIPKIITVIVEWKGRQQKREKCQQDLSQLLAATTGAP
ncbi:MAG: hypothetical protein Q8L08_05925 [Candidatus Nanopelagicaceae bacterium]|nr:hypothetical protein [Candidatus Nanopelagicaceae bacterium]